MKIEFKAGTLDTSDVDPYLEVPIREALEPFLGLVASEANLLAAKYVVLSVIDQYESNPLKYYLKSRGM